MAKERRSDPRMSLVLPLRVQGSGTDGTPWEEMTTTDDASFGGASFNLKHPIETGNVLLLAMPLPKRFRRHDLTEPSYRVYSLVRDLWRDGGAARVGVMFLGKFPPKGHEKNPGGRYLLPTDPAPKPKERRRSLRLDNLFLNVKLKRMGENGHPLQEERTVAENLGKGGARVMTSMPVAKGEVVVLEEMGGPFTTRAEICNVYIGQDRVPRLNLHFLDAEAPDRLVG